MVLDRSDMALAGAGASHPLYLVSSPTPGELRVLELVALGLSSREIAARLWISRQGVTYHIGNLFVKLRANSRAGLVARAYAIGLLAPGSWPPRANLPGFSSPTGRVILGG
jgi:DNA-binding CsgD family transcriptional regulator